MDPSLRRSAEVGSATPPRELAQKTLQANIAHQHALTKYSRQLEAELQELESLMGAVNTSDNGELEPEIRIPGAKKPAGPFPSAEFLNPRSPFFGEASQRASFINNVTSHPMKVSELDILAEAVRSENQRLQAYLSQQKQGLAAGVQIDLTNNTEGIDWVVIAEKVSNVSSIKRTADQCRIKWLGDRHPRINHEEWSSAELNKLKDIVHRHSSGGAKIDWVLVSTELRTNRTPLDCMRHAIVRQRHKWNQTFDARLLDAVKQYGSNNWNVVARYVSEDATAPQCQSRYSRLNPALKRGKWSKEEDSRLELAFKAYGNSWMEVAACVPGRMNDQCREHWSELSSSRAQWTGEEEKALVDAVSTMGNAWTKIAALLGHGRTGQQCRFRYDKLKKRQAPQPSATSSSIAGDDAAETLTPTGVAETRPAKKKGRVATPAKTSAPCGDIRPAPAPKPRPKPRPIGKGKAQATEREPASPTIEPESIDDVTSLNNKATVAPVSTKRKRTTTNTKELPPPKKPKSTKAASDNPSDATAAQAASGTTSFGSHGSVPESTESSTVPAQSMPTGHNDSDTRAVENTPLLPSSPVQPTEMRPIERPKNGNSSQPRRRVRGMVRSDVPRRQSARVAARATFPVDDNIIGTDPSSSQS